MMLSDIPNLTVLTERFWSRVDRSGTCWIWTRAKSRKGNGYGVFALAKRRPIYAHRMAFLLTRGSVDDRLKVLHECDNPPCCRPDHLFQGTQLENVQDMMRKGRYRHVALCGSENGRAILDEATVASVRRRLSSGEAQVSIARSLNVRPAVIWRIAHGRTWRHVS